MNTTANINVTLQIDPILIAVAAALVAVHRAHGLNIGPFLTEYDGLLGRLTDGTQSTPPGTQMGQAILKYVQALQTPISPAP